MSRLKRSLLGLIAAAQESRFGADRLAGMIESTMLWLEDTHASLSCDFLRDAADSYYRSLEHLCAFLSDDQQHHLQDAYRLVFQAEDLLAHVEQRGVSMYMG